MTLQEAIQFLSSTPVDSTQKSVWADLGCGSGLFSKALTTKLHEESIIYAIDQSSQRIITSPNNQVEIIFQPNNFIDDDLGLSNLDGVMMANALHYVKDKKSFIQKLKTMLLPTANIIIIEYDTEKANRWVPYPIGFIQLQELFIQEGYNHVVKTGERKSVYNSGKMYAALISK